MIQLIFIFSFMSDFSYSVSHEQKYVSFPDALSVDGMTSFFTDLLVSLPEAERESMGNIQVPVSHTTAWRWMHALGAR